jgi:hypothetical protein
MMGILVPETCWGNKTAHFVESSCFFIFTISTMHGHMNKFFFVSFDQPASLYCEEYVYIGLHTD